MKKTFEIIFPDEFNENMSQEEIEWLLQDWLVNYEVKVREVR